MSREALSGSSAGCVAPQQGRQVGAAKDGRPSQGGAGRILPGMDFHDGDITPFSQAGVNMAGPRPILVVDDDEALRETLSEQLAHDGEFAPEQASSAAETLARAANLWNHVSKLPEGMDFFPEK